MTPPPPRSPLFPYTTLFRSILMGSGAGAAAECVKALQKSGERVGFLKVRLYKPFALDAFFAALPTTDRKSTRLNSSHVSISYAVFCLKKKNYPHSRSLLRTP